MTPEAAAAIERAAHELADSEPPITDAQAEAAARLLLANERAVAEINRAVAKSA